MPNISTWKSESSHQILSMLKPIINPRINSQMFTKSANVSSLAWKTAKIPYMVNMGRYKPCLYIFNPCNKWFKIIIQLARLPVILKKEGFFVTTFPCKMIRFRSSLCNISSERTRKFNEKYEIC